MKLRGMFEASTAFQLVGPEGPLAARIVDDLEHAGIKAFGPSKVASHQVHLTRRTYSAG